MHASSWSCRVRTILLVFLYGWLAELAHTKPVVAFHQQSPGLDIELEIHRRWWWSNPKERGLVLVKETCPFHITQRLSEAINNAKQFIETAHQAIGSQDDKQLLSYFFNKHEFPFVDNALRNIRDRLNGVGPTVGMWCANNTEGSFHAWKCDGDGLPSQISMPTRRTRGLK